MVVDAVNRKVTGWYKRKTWGGSQILSKADGGYLHFWYSWSGWETISQLTKTNIVSQSSDQALFRPKLISNSLARCYNRCTIL